MRSIIDGDDIVRGLMVCLQCLVAHENGSFARAKADEHFETTCEGCDEEKVWGRVRFCKKCILEIAEEVLKRVPEIRS
jgi:hypothetical protein